MLFVGPDLRKMALDLRLDELNLVHRIQYSRLRPNRVYSGDEIDDYDPVRKARYARDMRKIGLADERVVRLLDEPSLSAWLTISSERECSAADGALLSNLAPYVAAAVRNFVQAQQSGQADALDRHSLLRAGCGWILFDATARVIAIAPATRDLLSEAFGHPLTLGQRLRELGPSVERALGNAAASFAQSDDAPNQAITLQPQPRTEAILSRPPEGVSTHLDAPAMLATCRQPRSPSNMRAQHLGRLHGLPPREAELAILLTDGLSLSDASAAMGLTIETTRNYSKRLFAKLGVRGQPELIRAVYESCIVLA